ncbi:MAG TPA: hypothetical protein VGS21_03025, partial [Acidimicrobiales bacterium]|nr:hypothetical protein [Acidimicrobiales bacterium]
EQDEVIRAELPGVLAVQGGPGTGKTAIGLHRAAYLLYNHPELARSGVLVVGPNRIFLRYIAQVLPSLGEEAVVQVALADLVPGVKTTVRDGFETQRAKGDARMAQVLARAVAARRTRVVDDLAVHVGLRRVVVRAADIDKLVTSLAARGAPYRSGRAALKTNMVRLVDLAARLAGAGDGIDRGFLTRELARQPQFGAAIDLAWPAVSAKALLTELLASPVRITEAAEGILSDAEQVALLRGSGKGFSQADLPLLDELHDLLAGNTHTYGHIVVDEAQDLTPMQLRMLGRRCPGGSVTVLGDLAQATGPWSPSNWEEVVAHLPQPSGWRQSELTLGYRAPGQVLDFASRLLREAAPGVPATTAVRPGRTAPFVLEVAPSDLLPAAVAEASRLSADGRSVGLIVADEDAKEAERFVRDVRTGDGSAIGLAERDGLRMPITLVGALAAKGLEFDSVVIVEPARIAGSTTRGLRLLYVALTRPIQHLSIVHSAPIPALLREPA